jgi:hypothetical protein
MIFGHFFFSQRRATKKIKNSRRASKKIDRSIDDEFAPFLRIFFEMILRFCFSSEDTSLGESLFSLFSPQSVRVFERDEEKEAQVVISLPFSSSLSLSLSLFIRGRFSARRECPPPSPPPRKHVPLCVR